MKISAKLVIRAEEDDALRLKHYGVTLGRHMTELDLVISKAFYYRIYRRGEDGRLEAANNWNRSKNL